MHDRVLCVGIAGRVLCCEKGGGDARCTLEYGVLPPPLLPCPSTLHRLTASLYLHIEPVRTHVTGGGAGGDEEVVAAMVRDLLTRLPPNFDVEKAGHKYPVRYEESLNQVGLPVCCLCWCCIAQQRVCSP